ncbi:MAG: helix-turn-helix domain-containing protein [Gammaproteobacteria bacterium]|jgi:transcriptional regulator with XRE-family HTH domain|nr:helix-turn-helix domain-containing protein [Gammaproteobacteria bacterium]
MPQPIHPLAPHPDETTLKQRIARNLRRLRRERELTGPELARASGIAPSYIVKIERHGANLTIDVLERLAAALGVPVTDLQGSALPLPGASMDPAPNPLASGAGPRAGHRASPTSPTRA